MLQFVTVLTRLSLAAALAGSLQTQGSDQPFQADVQRALATPYAMGDPEVVGLTLKLDLRLTNRSAKAVSLPARETRDGEATGIYLLSAQSKQPDGKWKYLFQSSWVGGPTTKYPPCKSLSTEGTAEIRNVTSGLVLLKKQLDGLGPGPTLRLGLWFFCQQPDDKEPIPWATTDPFVLRLPAGPVDSGSK